LSEQEVKTLLTSDVPSSREEIRLLAEKLVAVVPESERWFIQLEEVVNFPRLLQAWYNYFTLGTC